jgi:hypothetical protein
VSATQTLAREAPLFSERRPNHTLPYLGPPCHTAAGLTKPQRVQPYRMVETLLDRYETTDPVTRARGRSWYPECRRLLAAMADEYGRSVAQTVAVFAITSSNCSLRQNLSFTEAVLRGERVGGRYPAFQAPQIKAALSTRYPGRFVRGPKCRAFYRAVLGDTDALVLDRWSARAGGYVMRRNLNVTVRRELDVAYREVARICGETTRSLQAIVWLHARETTPNGRAVIPRYFDITKKEAA